MENRRTRPIGRRERKRLEVRQRICDAALELFRDKGYHATTVEEIAERADVAKGTFFNYFPRKDAVLTATGEAFLEELLTEMGPPESWQGTVREQLLAFLLRIWAAGEEEPRELMKEVILEGIATKGMLRDGVPADDVFRALLRSLLDEGKARGELDEDTDTYAAAKLIESVQTITMVECLQGEASRETFRDEITKQLDIVFRGLAAAARPGGRGEA